MPDDTTTAEDLLRQAHDKLMASTAEADIVPNAVIQTIGHVAAALHILKNQTQLEKVAAVSAKPAGDDGRHRVRLVDGDLHINGFKFSRDELAIWKMWSAVEAACKKLDPPLSRLELGVVERAAEHLGSGARNGLSELKSALASIRKA